jgi:acetylornithine deacetylase/succinyl-diaminopimelate desuccinylase-like protein
MTPETYLRTHRDAAVSSLGDLLRIPSVSALSGHRADVRRAAEWLATRLAAAGLVDAAVWDTAGHPVVTARTPGEDDRPTVLVYGHYDVQPVDPVEAWTSGPFDPTVRDGRLYARGAADDKGQLFMHILAAEACLAAGALPVRLQFVLEGEEEIGSPHFEEFVRSHQDLLQADAAVISDTPMHADGSPSICYGLRGLALLDVRVQGPDQDLHSGLFGGAVANPAHVLAELVASLHDADGRVAVDGFYDDVRALPPEEREALAALPFDAQGFVASTGSPAAAGESGYSLLERLWTRPTLDVNGMWSGFLGEGSKTIIPAYAAAKLSARLVPYQDPQRVLAAVTRHLERRCPDTVRLVVTAHGGSPAALTPLDHPLVAAARTALRAAYGRDPVNILMGGSIPAVTTFAEVLGIPTLLLGFALPEEHFHAPNEFLTLTNFWRGQETIAALWQGLRDWVPAGDGAHV